MLYCSQIKFWVYIKKCLAVCVAGVLNFGRLPVRKKSEIQTHSGIYIPFDVSRFTGGPATFMKNLKFYLDSINWIYSSKIEEATGIFFPISFDLEILKRFKQNKLPIIQRLDGVYYPEKHGEKYIELNKIIKEIYLNYSDFVVFQSEYSRIQCFKMFGEKADSQYTIIYNGVNQNIFYPETELVISKSERFNTKLQSGDNLIATQASEAGASKDYDKRFSDKAERLAVTAESNTLKAHSYKLITTGHFRNADMLVPIIKALDMLQGKFDFSLTIAGKITSDEINDLMNRNYIEYIGEKSLTEVAELLRSSHIYLFSSLNPPCPNSVLEAIACGMPVVGFNDGAMPELLYFSKELLAYASDDIFKSAFQLSPEALAEKISFAVANYDFFKQKALQNSNLYSLEECGQSYTRIFDKFISKF